MEKLVAGARAWGLELSAEQVQAFELYYRELVAWNERVNLTAITDYEEVQVKHFLDSLSCFQALTGLPAGWGCIDIGAGAGFPGLPLRIAFPLMRLTVLESTGKKAAFLEHIVAELGLSGVDVVRGRAEEAGREPGLRESFDAALARAVAELPVLVEYALPLVRVGGVFVAQKGSVVENEVEAARAAIALLGGELAEIQTVEVPGLDAPRRLVVVAKASPTPDKYPRRPGIPAKRPLRGEQ
jgi:16S rRNA (guanine527-N7)-methyltransferase